MLCVVVADCCAWLDIQQDSTSVESMGNHRTATAFEDALIVKTFCFQFVNSYCSLFYIAFFKVSDCFLE